MLTPRPLIFAALFALFLFCMAGWAGGAAFAPDAQLVQSLAEWRQSHPLLTSNIILLTRLGDFAVLAPLALIAAVYPALKSYRAAIALLGTSILGRLLVELLKYQIDRPRPSFDLHPVKVHSESFPSAHAANSMITYGAIALFGLPERWRKPGLVAAMTLSLLVGTTRPVLGVHWPTDVIGGWCLGLLWLLLCWTVWQRVRVPERTATSDC